MDLDEIELKATRKLLGLDKKENKQQNYDDNDYLIAREECIEYKKVTDKDVGDIEEAIEILKNAIRCNEKQFEELGTHILLQDDEQEAIKIVLANLEILCDMQRSADREIERQKQINKELKQKINDLDIDLTTVNIREFKENNSKIKNDYKKENLELREKVKKLEKENMQKDLEIIGVEEYTKASMKEIIEKYYTANEECISKQKIRNKIEEYKELVDDFEKTDNTGRFKRTNSIDYYKLEVLQELLQEEDK